MVELRSPKPLVGVRFPGELPISATIIKSMKISNTEARNIAATLIETLNDSYADEQTYNLCQWVIANTLNSAEKVVLEQIINKPTYDGDICSKSARDELISLGLATKCCYNGEQGYQVATYKAYGVWQMVLEKQRNQ